MANTKKLTGEKRKAAKRKVRKELKKLFGTLDRKQRRALRAEPQGLRSFVAKAQKAEGEKA